MLLSLLIATGLMATAVFQGIDSLTVEGEVVRLSRGDPTRGRHAVRELGCITCHDVPGYPDSLPVVAPRLAGFAGRVEIAGAVANSPHNLVRYLREPRAVVPSSGMPDLRVNESLARDLAAFLYTLE